MMKILTKLLHVLTKHKGIWSDKRLPIQLKVRLFKVWVLSILLYYGCESWTFTKKILANVRGFVGRCYFSISQAFKKGINKIDSFHAAMSAIDIVHMIDKRRWTWLGHVLRMGYERNPRRALSLLFALPDKKGTVASHLPHDIENENEAVIAASNRQDWKKRFNKRQEYVFVTNIML